MSIQTAAEVRQQLIEALQLDLIGPKADDVLHQEEVISQAPSKWYLAGFLVPYEADISQRSDDTGDDKLDQLGRASSGDDENTPEAASARKAMFPSSIGLSFLVSQATKELNVAVQWGDYFPLQDEQAAVAQAETRLQTFTSRDWRRKPRQESMTISLEGTPSASQMSLLDSPAPAPSPQMDLPLETSTVNKRIPVPNSGGLELVLSVRPVQTNHILPAGTRAVSLFLVNQRRPAADIDRDQGYIFQAQLSICSTEPFVPRPDLRGQNIDDEDEQIADLQYRDDFEFAVGHNVSATATLTEKGCYQIQTDWMPTADVEKVIPHEIGDVNLEMEALGNARDAEDIRSMVGGMVTAYSIWITQQQAAAPKSPQQRADVATELLHRAVTVNERINAGLEALSDPNVLEAFKIANRAIARAIRQRSTHGKDDALPENLESPKWRPFQLAFLLMNVVGIARPEHIDREIVDLLFFPTGGGKTEAYLGLAAFTLVLRRLRHPNIQSAGLSVLMRYTLRLLTLDQMGRAATLICALELERQQDVEKLGKWPFEIGLWVGQTATPNRMGRKGDNDKYSARARTIAYQNKTVKDCPIPLDNCPWCGTQFI
ncbi:MAG: hypothetical protein AAF329_00820 [Cyanobacteria bacterium P01_A01_bin.17]